MDDSVALDRKALKALSSEMRLSILKSLGKRRKMLSELSKEMDIKPSSMKGHMDNLLVAGLVEKLDDGHKWKYYELTRAGRNVVSPGGSRIWIMIGITAVALLSVSYGFFGMEYAVFGTDMVAKAPGILESMPIARDSAAVPTGNQAGVYAAGLAALSFLLGIELGFVLARRRNDVRD